MSGRDDTEQSAEDMIVEDLEGINRDKSPLRKQLSDQDIRGNKLGPRRVVAPRSNNNNNNNSNKISPGLGAGDPPRKKKKLLWQKGKLIGSGGFGKVFLGLDGNSGTLVAGKEFSFEGGNIEKMVKDLRAEMELMQKLNHKNIVKYYGADKRGALFYIFMEYVPGGSLRSILDQFGPIQDRVASRFTKQILTGLGYLHYNQVIHRDIKCANVLVNVDGVVKLADFGSAQFFTEAHGTQGTPFWMPPEVIRGEAVGWQCDIWSLGCSLIEMLTGETPFKEIGANMKILYYIAGNDPMVISDKITNPSVRDFILQCLQRDPAKRPTVQTLLNHDFITMFGRRLGTGDSQASFLGSSQASYINVGDARGGHGNNSRVTTAQVRGGGNNGVESPRVAEDLEVTSVGSMDQGNLLNPLAPHGEGNSSGGNSGGAASGLCRASLDALSSASSNDVDTDEELDDDVKSALVSRAMSLATKGSKPKPMLHKPLFSMVNINPIQSLADASGNGGLLSTVSMATGSESVLSMMANVIEVDKAEFIEIELEEELSGSTGSGSELDTVTPPMTSTHGTHVAPGGQEPSPKSKKKCSIMQILQLAVTILLIGVIAALATLLATKE